MATGKAKKPKEYARRTASFNKAVNAGADVMFSLAAWELGMQVGDDVKIVNIHHSGASVQPMYISYSLAKNVVEVSTDTMVNGRVYNPSTSNRTYPIVAECVVEKA